MILLFSLVFCALGFLIGFFVGTYWQLDKTLKKLEEVNKNAS